MTSAPRCALPQLDFQLETPGPRWIFSRLALASPHLQRIRVRIELVRNFFPELARIAIRVGLAKKRGVLGWGSLDPEAPGIWLRPRRIELFTIAHEMTHLLQARRLIPLGERSCDLWALARSPLLIDCVPCYLKIPKSIRQQAVTPGHAALLHEEARRAIAAREQGDRRYIARFEREVAQALERNI